MEEERELLQRLEAERDYWRELYDIKTSEVRMYERMYEMHRDVVQELKDEVRRLKALLPEEETNVSQQ